MEWGNFQMDFIHWKIGKLGENVSPWLTIGKITNFFFLISNKLYWYQKKDTLVHKECIGVNNQE